MSVMDDVFLKHGKEKGPRVMRKSAKTVKTNKPFTKSYVKQLLKEKGLRFDFKGSDEDLAVVRTWDSDKHDKKGVPIGWDELKSDVPLKLMRSEDSLAENKIDLWDARTLPEKGGPTDIKVSKNTILQVIATYFEVELKPKRGSRQLAPALS